MPDAKVRVAKRIRARLDELGMTGREVAKALGKSDGWISSVLSGTQGLQLDDLDGVADVLRWSPSDLVRHDDADLRELKPREMRLLRHYQQWPEQIQDRWLRILDFFAASAPDPDGAKLLDQWRDLSVFERRRLRAFLDSLRTGNFPQDDALKVVPPPSTDEGV